jgi:ribosomal protein S18 acetylase RimI-like enzyme
VGKQRPSAPGTVTIRLATEDDQALIEDLRRSVGWSPLETGLTSMMHGRSAVFILELNGRGVASGALIFRSDDSDLADGSTRALISNLIVNPEFQSHGFGTELLDFLEHEACIRGCMYVTIGVDAVNVRARKLYERHGYTSLKDKTEAWGPVNYLIKELECET